MRYYIISGEASGDLHGSNLIREMLKKDPQSGFRAWGGDEMKAAGAEIIKHYRDLAFMGFIEVLANLPTILSNLSFCKKDILEFKPDALILIDYPGFNLRIAEWAHQRGIRIVLLYIASSLGLKENRVRKMKKNIDQMLVILPFEKEYYRSKWHWDVEYVGHPLVEVVNNARKKPEHLPENSPLLKTSEWIAILPGSRKQEIIKKLPIMLEASRHFPHHHFMVAKAPGIADSFYDELLKPYPEISSVSQQTYALLRRSSAALVTSGTATLETALFEVPQVVCYKGSQISYQIAKRILTIKYISLVNLIMNKPVVKELIQNEFTVDNVRQALEEILFDKQIKASIQENYQSLIEMLSLGGNASMNAARKIAEFMHR